MNYLNGMKKDIGLLINFSLNDVDVKRKYRKPEKVELDRINEVHMIRNKISCKIQ